MNTRQAICHPDQPYFARNFCAPCYRKDWYQRNHEERLTKGREWRAANVMQHRAAAKQWRLDNPEQFKAQGRRQQLKRYGVTLEWYAAMTEKQQGRCAICGGTPSSKGLAVDHNHTTRQVRELLCDGCNIAVAICENIEKVSRVQAYLDRHSGSAP